MCDVMKSDNDPVIAGVGGIVILVGGHMLMKNRYKAEVKKGDNSFTLAPAVQREKEENGQPFE